MGCPGMYTCELLATLLAAVPLVLLHFAWVFSLLVASVAPVVVIAACLAYVCVLCIVVASGMFLIQAIVIRDGLFILSMHH